MAIARLQVGVGGMQCSFCRQSVERALSRLPGVTSASVNLAHEEALVEYDGRAELPAKVNEVLRALGYMPRDPHKLRAFEEEEEALDAERRKLLGAVLISGIGLSMMIANWTHIELPKTWVVAAMAVAAAIVIFGLGRHILSMAFAALRRGILNQHVLLSFSALGGFAAGIAGLFVRAFPAAEFFGAAAFLMTYHLLGSFTAGVVRTRASQAVRKVLELQPDTARVLRDEREIEISVSEVRVGELIRVRPGERIPLDGEVIEGAAGVDESMVTGEPLPTTKEAGGNVIAGSIDNDGILLVRTTAASDASFLARVAREVEAAKALKPSILILVERILSVYVPGVLSIAGIALIAWILVGFLQGTPEWVRATYAALSVLVMGYPCALGMATPLAMIRGGGEAAQRGALMRSAEAFEMLKDVRVVVFDKTGTLTLGKPRYLRRSADNDEALRLAASLERYSRHPLAKALVEEAESRKMTLSDPQEFRELAGHGVTGKLDGEIVRAGSLRFLESEGIDVSRALHDDLPAATLVGVARGTTLLGALALGDEIRDDARETVAELQRRGIRTVMITGDNERTARSVAQQIGIQDVIAQVLPNEKAEHVRRLQAGGTRVAMVGDGINDAPALMQSDVGIAIGAGTDIAIEAADIVVMTHSVQTIPALLDLGRNSYRKTRQNLALAFTFNGVGIPLAATGLLYPAWAMLAMLMSVSTVLLNSFGGRLVQGARQGATR